MSQIDFGAVKEELGEAGHMHVMQALVRRSPYHGGGNRPVTLIVTDKAMYFGGTESDKSKFKRISLKSVTSSSKKGFSLWECVKVTHLGLAGEETFYICPFEGSHLAPKKDRQMLELLLSILNP